MPVNFNSTSVEIELTGIVTTGEWDSLARNTAVAQLWVSTGALWRSPDRTTTTTWWVRRALTRSAWTMALERRPTAAPTLFGFVSLTTT